MAFVKRKPREKYIHGGINMLTDADLVALILGSGVKGKDVFKIADEISNLIKKHKKIEITKADNHNYDYKNLYQKLKQVVGVGDVNATKIISAIELGNRLNSLNNSIVLSNTRDIYKMCFEIYTRKQEIVLAFYLDARYRLIEKRTIGQGSVDRVSIQVRDILAGALECNASWIVLAHNHPSGDNQPSQEDYTYTKRLKEVADALGVGFLEHIVVTAEGYNSVSVDK